MRVTDTVVRSFLQRLSNCWLDFIEHGVIFSKTLSMNLRPHDDLAGGRINDHDDRDETLFSKDAAIFEIVICNLTHAGTVYVDITNIYLANYPCNAIFEIDDGAIFAQNGAVCIYA